MNIYRIFSQILNMSLTASIVICVVLIARLFLKRAPKIYSYVLWAVVLFRLLCPVSFSSEMSLFNVLEVPVTSVGSMEYRAFVPTDTAAAMENEQSIISESNNDGNIDTTDYLSIEDLPTNHKLTTSMIATYIWLGGISVMLIYSMISLDKLHRKLVGAVRMQDNIYLADHIASPFVIGLFRPRIYLPSSLSEQEQSYIILHEQHHIHRRDYLVKIVAFMALSIHWFNPLVWLAFILAGNDMEMSCDEAVMKKMENDIRADYSTSLLSLSTGKKLIAGTPLAFGEGNVKGRIKNVMNNKKPSFWVCIIAVVCITIVSVVLIFNPKEEKEKPYDIAVDFLTEHYERIYTGKEKDVSLVKNITVEINNEQETYIATRQQVMQAFGGYVKDLKLSFEQAEYEEIKGKVILTVNIEASFQYPNVDEKSGFGGNAVFEISKRDENYVISGCKIQDGSGDCILGKFSTTINGLQLPSYASYRMKTVEKDSMLVPEMVLDTEKNFTFSYDPLSSYLPHGKYTIQDNMLTAITDDGKYTYVFEIIDEKTIRFIQNGSSYVRLIDEKFSVPIEDGAEFELHISQPNNKIEQLQIDITASKKEVNYATVIHEWDGATYTYDRLDTLENVMLSSAGSGPVYVSEGETIEIEFLGDAPQSYELTAEIMNESGKRVPKDSRKTVPITFKNGKASFVFSKSDMDGWSDGKRVGYRLLCRWGENECEVGFVVFIKE